MGKQITKRQKDVLRVICNWIKNSGFPPSFSDLKEELGINSNQTILDHLENLEKKRLIKREEGSARGIKILKNGYEAIKARPLVPIIGTTSAGGFSEAIEEIGAWVPLLNNEAQRLSDDVFVVRVMGDSMINAGINEDDLILFKKTNSFVSRDIVLAQTPDGVTIKRFISQNKSPHKFLKPENPNYPIIPFTNEIEIVGKMVKKI